MQMKPQIYVIYTYNKYVDFLFTQTSVLIDNIINSLFYGVCLKSYNHIKKNKWSGLS